MSTEYQNLSLNILERQYGYKNVAALMQERAKVWDMYMGDIADVLMTQFFDIDNCTSEALDNYWGKLLNISRVFEDSDHNIYTLTDDEFREVVKIKLFNWDGTLISLNTFLRNVFKDRGKIYVVDSQNMTWALIIAGFDLTDNEKALFTEFDIFPRPAGIDTTIRIIDADSKFFGFGSYTGTDSPVAVGYGTYNGAPMGEGRFATYEDGV